MMKLKKIQIKRRKKIESIMVNPPNTLDHETKIAS